MSRSTAPTQAQHYERREQSRRFDELEAYRGVAALMIVVFHAYQHSREGTGRAEFVYDGTPWDTLFRSFEVGVGWFFVLSGFLVFLPFARAAVHAGRVTSSRAFLIRRAVRILPAYQIAFLIVWVSRYTGNSSEWRDLLAHMTFTHVFFDRYIFSTIGPAWSLGVEVIFYVALGLLGPAAILLCRRMSSVQIRATMLLGLLSSFAVASIGYKWWASEIAHIPEKRFSVYFGPLAKLDTLAIGMILAVIAALAGERPVLRGPMPMVARLMGMGIILWAFVERPHSTIAGVYFTTFAALGFSFVLASSVLAERGLPWEHVLSVKPMAALGIVSYGIYLWHEPILIELSSRGWLIVNEPDAFPRNAAVLVALAIAAGTASYWLIEKPTMFARYIFGSDGRFAARYADDEIHPARSRSVTTSVAPD